MAEFEPRIVAFLCNWCSYGGADQAGAGKRPSPASLRLMRVMCSGRVDPQLVIRALKEGADGVMILGCHPGDCHYKRGNYSALRRNVLLQELMAQFGIEPERVCLDWVAASEGEKFARVTNAMVARLKQLGPFRRNHPELARLVAAS